MYGALGPPRGSSESPHRYSAKVVPLREMLRGQDDGEKAPLIDDKQDENQNGGIKHEEDIKMDNLQVVAESEKFSFHQAARYGNEEVIKKYLHRYQGKRKKINKLDKNEWTALHYAVRHGHFEVIQVLLEGGADVNALGADGAQPLHTAAKYFKADKHMSDDVEIPATAEELAALASSPDADAVLGNLIPETTTNAESAENPEAEVKPPPPEEGEEVKEVITYLLRQGADVNCIDKYNQTPLHYAANKGNIEAVALLLSWPGIDLEITDTSGGTALHSACCGNARPDTVKLLLLAGSKLMVWDNERNNPLHYAATAEGGETIIEEIFQIVSEKSGVIENYEISDMLNEQDNQGQSVLHRAVDFGNLKLCQLILERGAKVNLHRENLATPLHLASSAGDLEIVKLLISYGANVEALNITSETPLHRAAKHCKPKVIEYLLQNKANIDADDQNNKTPLMMAAANPGKEAVEAVKMLLAHNADLTQVDSSEKSAIFWAAEENAVEVMKLLLEKVKKKKSLKYLIEATDRFENTPLHVASKKGFRPIVNLLIEHGAHVDLTNDEELTALHLAAIRGNHKVATSLLTKQGSIINEQDESGNTPLHLAALNGHVKLINLLIDFGGETDARNIMQSTPLDLAASKGHSECCIRLLERDAEINSLDLAKTTPLHVASREGYVEVVEALLEKGADVSLTDCEGRNALDMAIDNSHKDVALAILNHKDWLLAAKNRSRDGKSITTPMRRCIEKLPDVGYAMLNKCMKISSELPHDSEDFQVKFFYELIDDTYADWATGKEMDVDDDKSLAGDSEKSDDGSGVDYDANILTESMRVIMEKKETHPLIHMCENDCDKLLQHPLCLALIYDKWQKFGRVVFYSKFMLYFVFLLTYTAFVLVSTPLIPRQKIINGIETCYSRASKGDKDRLDVIIFFYGGRIVLLVLCFFQLLLELPHMYALKLAYVIDPVCWMQWTVYGSAALYAWPTYDDLMDGELETLHCITHVSIGAMGIFFAWINLLLFLQKFPMIGIYIVMFVDITVTFLKFSLTFVLFVFSFAIGFFTLLHDQFPFMFHDIGRTSVKTAIMMIGGPDYDTLFNDASVKPPAITWLLFIIFVVVMAILLTNLMVGLAVDDIQAVLESAVMKRITMQVNLVLDVEKSLPRRFRRKFLKSDKTVYPNREFTWYKKMLTSHLTKIEEIEQAVKPSRTVSDIVQEQTQSIRNSVENLKNNSRGMSRQLKTIEKMVAKLLVASNVPDDDDDDD